MNRRLSLSVVLLATLFLSSCGTYTEVYDTWANPSFVGHTWKKLVVVAMAKDPLHKAKVEAEVVRSLKSVGIDAEALTTTFSIETYDANNDGKIDDPNAIAQLVQKLKAGGVDGALMMALKGVDKKETYVPPSQTTVVAGSPYGGYYGYGYPYYHHYYSTYQTVYSPGYTTTTTSVVIESKLFDLNDEKSEPGWVGRSSTTDPTSITDFAQSFAPALVSKMKQDGVLKPAGK